MKITKNVFASVDENGTIHIMKFGFADITVSEANAIKEFAQREAYEGAVVSAHPEIQKIISE